MDYFIDRSIPILPECYVVRVAVEGFCWYGKSKDIVEISDYIKRNEWPTKIFELKTSYDWNAFASCHIAHPKKENGGFFTLREYSWSDEARNDPKYYDSSAFERSLSFLSIVLPGNGMRLMLDGKGRSIMSLWQIKSGIRPKRITVYEMEAEEPDLFFDDAKDFSSFAGRH